MVKPIKPTPTLYGKDAIAFIEEMEKLPTSEDKKFREKMNKQRKVKFL